MPLQIRRRSSCIRTLSTSQADTPHTSKTNIDNCRLPTEGSKHVGNTFASTESVEEYLAESFQSSMTDGKCSNQAYIFVDQPNVASFDINARYQPHLHRRLSREAGASSTQVKHISNVVGSWSNGDLESTLQKECGGIKLVLDGSKRERIYSMPGRVLC